MKREVKVIKNTLIYAVGNFASKFLGFLLLPLYTGYLSVEDFGYYDLILITVSLFLPIVTLQIFDGLYRYLLGASNEIEKNTVISNSFFIVIRNLIVFNILYFIIIVWIDLKYEILILLYLNLLILSQMFTETARGLKENVVYSIAGFIGTCISLFFSIVTVAFLNMKIEGLLISLIFSSIGAILFIEFKLKITKRININVKEKSMSKDLLQYSIPLIPNVINWWVMNVSDRYLLNYFIDLNANGIYAVANKFPSILMIVNTIFYMAWQESAITEHNSEDRDKYYTKMFNTYLKLQWCAVLILLAITKPLMEIVVKSNFEEAWLYVPFLYFAVIFSSFSSFYGIGFQSSKETKGAFTSSVIGSAINLILSIILLPLIGIQGATLSTLVAFLAMWVIRIYQTKKYFIIKIEGTTFVFLMLISILFLYLYYINTFLTTVILLVLSLVITYLLNKGLIHKVWLLGSKVLKKLAPTKYRRTQ